MNIIETDIPDVKIIEPSVHEDERGFFFESFNQKNFEEAIGRKVVFVQDNHSKSNRGVLRGLHYQLEPKSQGKLVRAIVGEIFDVAVDIRESSATYLSWVGARLSARNKRQLWIPEGFAHGFLTLSETAECLYKSTDFYCPAREQSIVWNDPKINIDWGLIDIPTLSDKDKAAKRLEKAEVFK